MSLDVLLVQGVYVALNNQHPYSTTSNTTHTCRCCEVPRLDAPARLKRVGCGGMGRAVHETRCACTGGKGVHAAIHAYPTGEEFQLLPSSLLLCVCCVCVSARIVCAHMLATFTSAPLYLQLHGDGDPVFVVIEEPDDRG